MKMCGTNTKINKNHIKTRALLKCLRSFRFLQFFTGFGFGRKRTGAAIHLLRRVTRGQPIGGPIPCCCRAASPLHFLIRVDLSPWIPYFEGNRLDPSVPDVQEDRDHNTGDTHHDEMTLLSIFSFKTWW